VNKKEKMVDETCSDDSSNVIDEPDKPKKKVEFPDSDSSDEGGDTLIKLISFNCLHGNFS